MEDVHVTDDGALHKYRTEIPNTVVRGTSSHRLRIYAKWLYVYLKSVAGDGLECFQSTTTLAGYAGHESHMVSAAKEELVRQGLIRVGRAAGKTGRLTAFASWISGSPTCTSLVVFLVGTPVFLLGTPAKN